MLVFTSLDDHSLHCRQTAHERHITCCSLTQKCIASVQGLTTVWRTNWSNQCRANSWSSIRLHVTFCLRLQATFCLRLRVTFCLRLHVTFCLCLRVTLCMRLHATVCLRLHVTLCSCLHVTFCLGLPDLQGICTSSGHGLWHGLQHSHTACHAALC